MRNRILQFFRKLFKAKSTQRFCYRCFKPIKRNHHWSAKSWIDGKPRHWMCSIPEGIKDDPAQEPAEAQHQTVEANTGEDSTHEAAAEPIEGQGSGSVTPAVL